MKKKSSHDGRLTRQSLAGIAILIALLSFIAKVKPTSAGAQERQRRFVPETFNKTTVSRDETQSQDGLVVTDLTNKSPADLAAALIGSGVSIRNVVYRGASNSAGSFTGGAGIIGFDRGIILSTGRVQNVVGPNTFGDVTQRNGLPGDSQLSGLILGLRTLDATVLEFDFVPVGNVVSFQYVFSSDEYNEFVGEEFNDVFGFFLNGQNVAMLPGGNVAVAINNVNGGNPFGTNPTNPQFYLNNDLEDGGATINTEMDGLTVVLSVQAQVVPGQLNHIKLAIADASDDKFDSNVFIKAASFTDQTPKTSDLQVTQAADSGVVVVGSQVAFNITVANLGPDAAESFTVFDSLPSFTAFVSCSASGGGVCGGLGNNRTITFQGLAAGASVTATIVARAGCPPAGTSSINNTARANSATFDPIQSNNTATAVVNIVASDAQIRLIDGRSAFDFGSVPAARELNPNPPSQTFTLENTGCASSLLNLAINRTGSDAMNGRIANTNDSALFPVRIINADGSETPLPISPGSPPVSLPGGQRRSFRVQFNPLIPILAGRTTELFANQVIPDVITSQLTITSGAGAPLTINLTGRVSTPAKMIHPSDSRLEPLVIFTRAGDEFTIECSTHDSNLDLRQARYQFLDRNDQPVGAGADVGLAQPIAQRNLVRGQSFTIIQKFTGASQRPEINKVQVTLLDGETTVTTASAVLGVTEAAIASVSAASFLNTALASESIVSSFGSGLAPGVQTAAATPLPTSLAGVAVRVRDGAGFERASPLFFVSPGQINFQIPPGTMVGAATVSVVRENRIAARGVVQITNALPGLFAANANGQGAAAAVALRIGANGSQQFEPVTQFDPAQNRFITRSLNFGPSGEQLYLALFGAGVRFRRSATPVVVRIGGVESQAIFAGAQGGFVGLDQINVLVPRSLAGRGEVDVTVTLDGITSNPVRVRFGGSASALPANRAEMVNDQNVGASAISREPAAIRLPTLELTPDPALQSEGRRAIRRSGGKKEK